MVAWTTPERVVAALGPGAAPPVDDAYLDDCVAASNAWCHRKRIEAGYDDADALDAPAPSQDVGFGATLYAVALWRERASTDGYNSFEDLGGFQPTGGSSAQINRLLGVPKGRADVPPTEETAALRRHRRVLRYGTRWW